MNKQEHPFSLGLTYWPRRKGFRWWQAFDRSETREELTHIAALGCNTVRFCLRWEDFQPGPQRINATAMRWLEDALDIADQCGLKVVLALFPVAIGGALQWPAWANGIDLINRLRRPKRFGAPKPADQAERPLLLHDGTYHINQVHDPFGERALLDAQRYLIGEIVGYFGPHPAAWAWQLGEGLERVAPPASPETVYAWYATLAEAARYHYAKVQLLGVTSTHGLTRPSGPRPDQIVRSCDLLGVSADPPIDSANQPLHTPSVSYLHDLTAALGGASPIISSIGLPTAPDGQSRWIDDIAYSAPLRSYLANLEEQAIFVEQVLDRMRRSGAAGVWLASYADYTKELWRDAPLDRAIRERMLGLVDAAGKEKPAAAALQHFAQTLQAAGSPPTNAALEVDPEPYWRDPQRRFRALWQEYAGQ